MGELWNSINQVETSQHLLCQPRTQTMPSLCTFFQLSNHFLDLQIWSLMLHCLASFVREREPRRREALQTAVKATIIPSGLALTALARVLVCLSVLLLINLQSLFSSLQFNFVYLSLLSHIHPF